MVLEYLVQIANDSMQIVRDLGDRGRENLESPLKARICLAEQKIFERTQDVLYTNRNNIGHYILMAEKFPPVEEGTNPEYVFTLDPLDGTVYYARQRSENPYPYTVVTAALRKAMGKLLKYDDVEAATIAELHSPNEMWYAGKDTPTTSSKRGLVRVGGNEDHDPLWQSDYYFPQNAAIRLHLRNPKNPEWDRFENLNPGSVAWQACKVACGEADVFFNGIGPKGYELTAMNIIVKKAGGINLHLPTETNIDNLNFEFNERVPLVMAKDETTAKSVIRAYGKIK